MSDVFDTLDIFDTVEGRFKPYVAPPRVDVHITDEIRGIIRAMVMSEVAEIVKDLKPSTQIIEKTIKMPEKVIVKEMVDKSSEILKEAEKRIKKEIDALDKSGRFGPIVVPSPIADQNGHGGQVLSTNGSITRWIDAPTGTGSGGSGAPFYLLYTATNYASKTSFDADDTSLDELANVVGSLIALFKTGTTITTGFTATNVTTDRSYDCADTSLDELADVIGTLINSLKPVGISLDAYTVADLTATVTYDATNTSLQELAFVVGSLLASLRGAGFIQ